MDDSSDVAYMQCRQMCIQNSSFRVGCFICRVSLIFILVSLPVFGLLGLFQRHS